MIERTIEIPTSDGVIPTFTVAPESNTSHPVILVYMDVFGIREELKNFCRQLCQESYFVMLPSLFYRDGNPSFDPVGPTEEERQQCHALNNKTSNGMVIQDTGALFEFLKEAPLVNHEKVGAVGTCMGGRHALFAASEYPDQVRSFASIYGGRMATGAMDSPHLAIPRLQAEAYFGWADQDKTAPQGHLKLYQQELKRHHVSHHIDFMEGVYHGYIFPERDCHHPEASKKTWAFISKMFARNLKNGMKGDSKE